MEDNRMKTKPFSWEQEVVLTPIYGEKQPRIFSECKNIIFRVKGITLSDVFGVIYRIEGEGIALIVEAREIKHYAKIADKELAFQYSPTSYCPGI